MKQFTTKRKTLEDTHAQNGTLKTADKMPDVHHPETYPYYRLNQEPENIFELSQTLPSGSPSSSSPSSADQTQTPAQQNRARAQAVLALMKQAREHELELLNQYYQQRIDRLQQFIANPLTSSSNSSSSSISHSHTDEKSGRSSGGQPGLAKGVKDVDRKPGTGADAHVVPGERQEGEKSSNSNGNDGTVIFGTGMPVSAATSASAAHFAAAFPKEKDIPVHILAASAIVFPTV